MLRRLSLSPRLDHVKLPLLLAGFVSLAEASGATNAIVSCCLGTTTLLHIAQGEELQNYYYTLLKQQLSLCGLFTWNCVLLRRGTLQMQACGVLLGHPSPHRWPTSHFDTADAVSPNPDEVQHCSMWCAKLAGYCLAIPYFTAGWSLMWFGYAEMFQRSPPNLLP